VPILVCISIIEGLSDVVGFALITKGEILVGASAA
jgi:hypothetical protein